MPVIPMGLEHAGAAADLHIEALRGDFLPTLGARFLRTFYRGALGSGAAFGLVEEEQGCPVGFVLGGEDTSVLFRKVLASSMIPLAWAMLPALLRHPGLILRVFETFLYPSREGTVPQKAELIVIAVAAGRRDQGIGERLVSALEDALKGRRVTSYKVTVLKSNTGANRFYLRRGFRLADEFRLYSRGWNLYVRDI
ncbi:MAG: GNAT family N-acetyltransferase [Planctomycetes bacterium]|nr:GNAT family N-acetyltransferase [Planctomycetota bacterium]